MMADAVAGAARLSRVDFHFGQFLRVWHGQASQAHRVEQVEDGGVGADAEREAQNRDAEETRFEPEEAKRVTKILPERFQKADGVHTMGGFLGDGDVAEFTLRGEGGFSRIHAAGDVVVDLVLEVGFDLEGEITIALRTPEVFKPTHVSLSADHSVAGPSTRAMALTIWSQRLRSLARCFRPVGVMR